MSSRNDMDSNKMPCFRFGGSDDDNNIIVYELKWSEWVDAIQL